MAWFARVGACLDGPIPRGMAVAHLHFMTIVSAIAALATFLGNANVGDRDTYGAVQEKVSKTQATLAAEYRESQTDNARQAVVEEARKFLFQAIVDGLIPPWFGTPWDFYGTSQTPGRGRIACGYFVSTILRDAGFRVNRIKLAQQASELIVRSITMDGSIHRQRDGSVTGVLSALSRAGDGLYVVGLDYHVGFLIRRDGVDRFCHSSYLGPATVVCARPDADPAFQSNYHVFGPVLGDGTVVAWLKSAPIVTVLR